MQQKQLILNDKTVSYWTNQSTAKEAVIFLHGHGGDHRGLLELAVKLRGYRVILPDLPGFGHSDPLASRHDFIHYADWLDDFRTALAISRFRLVGHSFGATIAFVYAGRYPTAVKQLTLLNPVTTSRSLTADFGKLFFKIAAALPSPIDKFALSNRLSVYVIDRSIFTTKSRWRRRQILNQDYVNYALASPSALVDGYFAYFDTPLLSIAETITCPTLLVAGTNDAIAPIQSVEKLADTIINSELLITKKAGHLFPMERPAQAARTVRDWLKTEN